jgi:serine/threonine protein phosphatase PrpC
MPEKFASTQDIGRKGSSRIFIEWRVLTCPKAEYDATTTEDRWAENAPLGLFAVADGVGSSFRAADWAKALVGAWTNTPFRNKFPFEVEWWVRKLQPRFTMSQDEIAKLQPFAQEQARRGAGSTLLGLRLWPASDGKSALYQLLCIGDSDLLHYPNPAIALKHDGLGSAFPISDPAKFGSYPTVLRSKAFDRKQDLVLRYPDKSQQQQGAKQQHQETPLKRLQQGDTLLLCTDAIAKWALETDKRAYYHDEVESARVQLEQQTPATWQAFVEDLRHAGQLVDDDTTALFIRIAHDQRAPAAGGAGPDGWQRVELTYPAIERAERSWSDARRAEMEAALRQQPVSAIEVARIFGDGRYFSENYRDAATVMQLAKQGRERADALDQVNEALRTVSWERPTSEQVAKLQALRQRYGAELDAEPSARGALATMLDVLNRPIAPPASSPVAPAAPRDSGTLLPPSAGPVGTTGPGGVESTGPDRMERQPAPADVNQGSGAPKPAGGVEDGRP